MNDQTRLEGPSFVEVISRRWLTVTLTYVIFALIGGALVVNHKTKYAAVAHVLLVNDRSGRDPSDAGLDMPTIVTSTTVLQEAKRKLRLSDDIPTLRKAVAARVAPRSSIMTIIAQSTNAQTAVDLPNVVADSFVEQYSKLSNTRYDEVALRLQNDLGLKRHALLRLERNLERASSGASYVGSQTSLDATAAHLAELQETRSAVSAQLETDRMSLQLSRAGAGKLAGVVRHEILMNNAAYRQSDLEISRDIAGYTTARAGVNASYPGMAGLRDKVRQEMTALNRLRTRTLNLPDSYSPSQAEDVAATNKARSALSGDETRLTDLNQQIQFAKSSLLSTPPTGESIGAIRAERDAVEAQFQALALRVANAEASSAESSSLGQVVVVDRALKADPTLISRPMLLVLAFLSAAVVAIAAAYGSEIAVPRLIDARDVERVYGKGILGTLGSN